MPAHLHKRKGRKYWEIVEGRTRVATGTDDKARAEELLGNYVRGGRSHKDMMLYVIRRPGGPIKVGVSRSPKNRLIEMQTACAEPLEILAVLSMADVEKAIHRKLAAESLSGEWFSEGALRLLNEIFGMTWLHRRSAAVRGRPRKVLKSLVVPTGIEPVFPT
jgi:hypothetical protein